MDVARAAPRQARRQGAGRLTVATWNLHEAVPISDDADVVGPSVPRAVEETIALLTDRRVDIAAFQEVGFDSGGTSELMEAVRRHTPLRYVAAHPLHESSFFPGRLSGVAVASRFPIREHVRHMLPNPELRTEMGGKEIRTHDKGLVAAAVDLGDGVELSVVSLHSFPFYLFHRDPHEAEFKAVWDALADRLGRQRQSDLALVCGDFNTEDRGLVLDAGALSLASSLDGQSSYGGKSVDDVLYGPGLVRRGVDVVVNYSDHSVCIVDFGVGNGEDEGE